LFKINFGFEATAKSVPVSNLTDFNKEDVPMSNTQTLTTSTALKTLKPASEKKFGKIKDLLTPVLRRHLKLDLQAQRLIELPTFVGRFNELVEELFDNWIVTYPVTVDYTRNLSQMIIAGNYKYVERTVCDAYFPQALLGPRKSKIEMAIVNYGTSMTRDGAINGMYENGFRPATLPELLAFGEAYPDFQLRESVSIVGKNKNAYDACLGDSGSGNIRTVRADSHSDEWGWANLAAVRL
jgi:hypothetical protein